MQESRLFKPAVLIASLCAFVACREQPRAVPASLAELSYADTEIYPLASGAVVLLSSTRSHSKLYLLVDSRAAPISGAPEEGVPDIYALADGSAYLAYDVANAMKIYHLVGQRCTPVTETHTIASLPSGADLGRFLWAANQGELTRAARERKEQQREEEAAYEEYRSGQ
jgi:hypothetical protein